MSVYYYLFYFIYRRIQCQYDHLEQEYRQTCIGVLRSSNTRGCGKVNISTLQPPPSDKNYNHVYFYINSCVIEQPQSTGHRTATNTESTGKSKLETKTDLKKKGKQETSSSLSGFKSGR